MGVAQPRRPLGEICVYFYSDLGRSTVLNLLSVLLGPGQSQDRSTPVEYKHLNYGHYLSRDATSCTYDTRWTNIFGKVRSLVEPKLLAQNENDSSKSLLIAKASKPQIANILDLLRRFDAILDESGIMIWSFYERQATLIGGAPTFVLLLGKYVPKAVEVLICAI